jgi:hypothetical protein
VVLAVFVDDILIACDNNKILRQVKHEFRSRFEMTDLRRAQEFLGIVFFANRPREREK